MRPYVLTADKIITEKEFKKLIRACREKIDALLSSNDPLLIRYLNDYFFISIGYYTGLRVSEISDLRWCDLNREGQNLLVRKGKGDRPRTVHFGPTVTGLFNELQTLQRKYFRWTQNHLDGYVFISPKNRRRLKRGGMHLRFKEQARLAGIRQCLSVHSLRHGAATRMISLGIPLHAVKDQLGHSSLNTTQVYLHFTDDLKERIAKVT